MTTVRTVLRKHVPATRSIVASDSGGNKRVMTLSKTWRANIQHERCGEGPTLRKQPQQRVLSIHAQHVPADNRRGEASYQIIV